MQSTIDNPFAVERSSNPQQNSVTAAMVTSRSAQEVQAAMVIAKKFPRDEVQAYNKIILACRREGLAEEALYSYPKGGTKVQGPSIRLAEAIAQRWGNIDFGIIELEQRLGETTVMAYAWDLETNTKQTKIFHVAHIRKSGDSLIPLTDPRDIYEMVANQGARRVRNCILGVIPGDVVEAAEAECIKTLKSGSKEPLIDRIRKMAGAFLEYGVTIEMLEERLGHKIDATDEAELVNLRKIFNSLKDGQSSRTDWFKSAQSETGKANAPTTPAKTPNKTASETKKPEQEKQTNKQPETTAATESQTQTADDSSSKTEAPTGNGEGASTSTPKAEETIDPQKDLQTLINLLIELKVDEERFLKWLKVSKYFSTPIDRADKMAQFAPKKLHHLVTHWDKYKDQIAATQL